MSLEDLTAFRVGTSRPGENRPEGDHGSDGQITLVQGGEVWSWAHVFGEAIE